MSWAQARDAIAEHICIISIDRPDSNPRLVPMFGENCKLAGQATPLQEATATAWKDATPFLISIAAIRDEADALVQDEPMSDALVDEVRAVHMQEPFLRVLVPRLESALAALDMRCEGCPQFDARPTTRVSWDEFAPYLVAHVWPDPVVTPRDEHGKPTGEPKYSLHICGGINGVSKIDHPDTTLVQAGFLAAFNGEAIHTSAVTRFQELRAEPEFTKLVDDDARTRFLREHLGARLRADPTVRSEACRVLDEFRSDLGMILEGC